MLYIYKVYIQTVSYRDCPCPYITTLTALFKGTDRSLEQETFILPKRNHSSGNHEYRKEQWNLNESWYWTFFFAKSFSLFSGGVHQFHQGSSLRNRFFSMRGSQIRRSHQMKKKGCDKGDSPNISMIDWPHLLRPFFVIWRS